MYRVSPGLEESRLSAWLDEAAVKYGTFTDGRVDYTHADLAPVIMATLNYGDQILLLKRGHNLADANGYWSVVSGFLDRDTSVTDQVITECQEELSISVPSMQVTVGTSYTLDSSDTHRRYIIFPCLVRLPHKPTITLDAEHTEYSWITRDRLESFHILDDTPFVIDRCLAL